MPWLLPSPTPTPFLVRAGLQFAWNHLLTLTSTDTPPQPTLPPEIWTAILRYVTNAPQQSVERAPPYTTPALPAAYRATLEDQVRNASALSRPLRLVSSKWCSLLEPIFWKVIGLKHRNQYGSTAKVRSVRDSLEASARRDPHGNGVGKYIQEITFHLHYLSLPDFGRILRCCTSLQSLYLHLSNEWSENTIHNHITLPSSLRHFQYYKTASGLFQFPKQLAQTVASSNTTSLHLSYGFTGGFPELLSFPKLEALHLHNFQPQRSGVIATWELPLVTRITIDGLVKASTNPLLQSLGPQLLFLEIRAVWSEWWADSLRATQRMHKLKELVLPATIIDEIPEGVITTAILPPITHLGISANRTSDLATPNILDRVLQLPWPALRCVKFATSEPNPNPNLSWPDISNFKPQCLEAGIAVEDPCGRSIFDLQGKTIAA